MKKMMKRVLSITAAATILFSISVPSYSANTDALGSTGTEKSVLTGTAESIQYSQQEIDAMWEEASARALTLDKANERGITPRAMGSYPTRKGVILVTPDFYKGLLPTGHCAIIYTANSVVEATSGGVTTGRNNWDESKSKAYGVTPNSTLNREDSIAANYCYDQRGLPYSLDFWDKSTRHKFYCSQLIWAAYWDEFGIDLDTPTYGSAIHPMELVNNSKLQKVYES